MVLNQGIPYYLWITQFYAIFSFVGLLVFFSNLLFLMTKKQEIVICVTITMREVALCACGTHYIVHSVTKQILN